jgi:ribosomal protein L34E
MIKKKANSTIAWRRLVMSEKKFKQICTCEKCGNEAEMIVTCQWVEVEAAKKKKKSDQAPVKVKGTGTCTSCGSEADTWVDL